MPLESGSVTTALEARVFVNFASGGVVECVVDTGFDGQLMLPSDLTEVLQLIPVGREVFEIAGGNLITADIALAEVRWLAEQRWIEVILSEGHDALIGTGMLVGTKLLIDYAAGSVVISGPE